MSRKKFDFEKGIARLEEIVEKLENDEVELEKAIALFEEGMELSQKCMKMLDDAQQKIEFLIKNKDTQKVEKVPYSEEVFEQKLQYHNKEEVEKLEDDEKLPF
jgi:exodeoxyribonuclease VII small subunit